MSTIALKKGTSEEIKNFWPNNLRYDASSWLSTFKSVDLEVYKQDTSTLSKEKIHNTDFFISYSNSPDIATSITFEKPRPNTKKIFFLNKSSSFENSFNTERLANLKKHFTSDLLLAIKHASIEPGILGEADVIVSDCLKKNAVVAMTWLSDLFIDNFNRPTVAADLLLLVSRMPYETAKPIGMTMAIGGLSHSNSAVQEAAIRAFENWGTVDCLKVLEAVEVTKKWLKDYVEDVKRDLKAIHSETT